MPRLLDDLKKLADEKNIFTKDKDKAYASIDKSSLAPSLPFLVIKPSTVAELINVATCCFLNKTPVVIRASGTGKSGGAIAKSDAVVIDISGLNRIISISKEDLVAEVEPGVILNTFQQEVKKLGLFYPPDPASFEWCSIGGNVAENAAGPSTIKYGTTKDYLLGGQVLLSSGELIDFGKNCPKGVTGYDLSSLLCGSEGTLAIFTKLKLRLLPLPKSISLVECFFYDENQALSAVNLLLNRGHRPKTLEFIDRNSLLALYKFLGEPLPKNYQACLIIECDASYQDGALAQIKEILLDLKEFKVTSIIAEDEKDCKALWHKRSMLSESCQNFLGHKISEDVAVPLGKQQEFSSTVKALIKKNLTCAFFGHAADGNLHVQIMFSDETYLKDAEELRHQILLLVLKLKGTLTAEHGIGLKKKSYLHLEQSQSLINLQKRVKKAFDLENLLNPGKIFDL